MALLMERPDPGFHTLRGEAALTKLSESLGILGNITSDFTLRHRSRRLGKMVLTDHIFSPLEFQTINVREEAHTLDTQVLLVSSGNLHVKYRNLDTSAHAGDLCTTSLDGVLHMHNHNPVRILGLQLPGDLIPETRKQIQRLTRPILPRSVFAIAASAYLQKLIRIHNDSTYPVHNEAEIELTTANIINACFQEARRDKQAADQNDNLMQKIQLLIEAHHTNPVFKVESIARSLHLSARQLYRLHQGELHTIAQKITLRRLKSAQDTLNQNPGLTLHEVARISGFTSAATMRDAFKTYLQLSPSEYADSTLKKPLTTQTLRRS